MPLNEHDKDLIEAMFRDDCDVNTVLKVVPHAARRTVFRMQQNMELFGQVRKPSSAVKRRGAPRKITPVMREYLMELLCHRNDLWQEELVFELWCQFEIVVNKSTVCRLLAEEELSKKVNTRIAARQSTSQQGVYLKELCDLMARGLEVGIDPLDMVLFLDESAASEKVLFRNRSWSQIGLPAYTRSELMNKTRCSVLPALDIHGYIPGATLVVEGAVTQAMYEHWLETVILPQCEPFPGKRSIVIMDNCSTHHSDKVCGKFWCGRHSKLTPNRSLNWAASLVYICYTCRHIHHTLTLLNRRSTS
jgi:transposase